MGENGKKILVIEDAEPVRELLCELLETRGFHVRGCGDGLDALHAAADSEFHIIITDYRMPNMNGVDATKHLRTRFPASTIIGMSSDDKEADFLTAGADVFLKKPYKFAELIDLVGTKPH